jgi:hypothetical protein
MKRIIMLSTLAIALGLTAILVGTTATLAQNTPTPIESTFTIKGACDFPVLFESSGKFHVVELPGGVTFLHAPSGHYTLTNLEEPDNQVRVATFTSVKETPLSNSETLVEIKGHVFFFGPGSFELLVGHFTFLRKGGSTSQGGSWELLSSEGRLDIDLCAQLA